MKSEAFRQKVVVDVVPESVKNQVFFGLHSLKVCLLFSIQNSCVELQCHSSFLVSSVVFFCIFCQMWDTEHVWFLIYFSSHVWFCWIFTIVFHLWSSSGLNTSSINSQKCNRWKLFTLICVFTGKCPYTCQQFKNGLTAISFFRWFLFCPLKLRVLDQSAGFLCLILFSQDSSCLSEQHNVSKRTFIAVIMWAYLKFRSQSCRF